uniref:SCP domain-containing protein n=1 Tax=Panagrolaimus davidi TaxID=227884 RepID=A0A914PKI9_9BILA
MKVVFYIFFFHTIIIFIKADNSQCECASPSPTSIITSGINSLPQCSTTSPLTPKLRQVFVDKHNGYRSTLANGKSQLPDGSFASPASNMYKLKYSCDLEKVAQEWADRCIWEHSPVDHRNGGENLYAIISGSEGKGQYFEQSIQDSNDAWWNELRQFGGITSTNVTLTMPAFNTGIGHWSQMAWATTQTVGCGFRECSRPDGTIMFFVVCNYRPSGNYLNQNIYQIGQPCSRNSSCTAVPNSSCEISTGLCYVN